jgi:hypothetical protein
MADGSPAGPADGLTPRQEEVRRLLADARHTGPMPADLAGRLDQVLAGLATGAGDDRATHPATPVVSLASRRRRRATIALAAAAAVVAVGVGLGQVVGNGLGGGESADSSAAGSAQDGRASTDRGVAPERAGGEERSRGYLVREPLTVSPQHFSSDVRRIRAKLGSLIVDQTSKKPSALPSATTADVACAPDSWGRGSFVPVRYGRQRGLLVFRAAQGDAQVVDLFACGNPEALRSVTRPAP